MKRVLTGLCALALSAGLLTACSESRTDRVGERPGDRTPSASPPSSTLPPSSTMPPSSSAPSSSSDSSTTTTAPQTTPSSPSSSGTK